jgi:negative regulator of sigma E activity
LLLAFTPAAHAQDPRANGSRRAAQAARQLSYRRHDRVSERAAVETSRLAHLYANGVELEKLVSLDGPAREVVRTPTDVRYYYPT